MNQLDLFAVEEADTKKPGAGEFPVQSGQVGAIRFGATEVSYRMTREVLIELAKPPGDAAGSTS
jgi:hypothetical protein